MYIFTMNYCNATIIAPVGGRRRHGRKELSTIKVSRIIKKQFNLKMLSKIRKGKSNWIYKDEANKKSWVKEYQKYGIYTKFLQKRRCNIYTPMVIEVIVSGIGFKIDVSWSQDLFGQDYI